MLSLPKRANTELYRNSFSEWALGASMICAFLDILGLLQTNRIQKINWGF